MDKQEKKKLERRLETEQRKRANMEELIDDIEETLFEYKRKEIANGEAKKSSPPCARSWNVSSNGTKR